MNLKKFKCLNESSVEKMIVLLFQQHKNKKK